MQPHLCGGVPKDCTAVVNSARPREVSAISACWMPYTRQALDGVHTPPEECVQRCTAYALVDGVQIVEIPAIRYTAPCPSSLLSAWPWPLHLGRTSSRFFKMILAMLIRVFIPQQPLHGRETSQRWQRMALVSCMHGHAACLLHDCRACMGGMQCSVMLNMTRANCGYPELSPMTRDRSALVSSDGHRRPIKAYVDVLGSAARSDQIVRSGQ